jgi:hypothetical protein
MHDTFYLAPGVLLRSHTSPVQVRTMQQHAAADPHRRAGHVLPPRSVRRVARAGVRPARGLAVDEGITFVDLKATLAEFARGLFGDRARVRFRPSYFPFTEPSAEVDVSCMICGGGGCSACKGTGWIEIMGAGMVHPAVFEHVGYDPERYTGFAFGMGPAASRCCATASPTSAAVRFGRPFPRAVHGGGMNISYRWLRDLGARPVRCRRSRLPTGWPCSARRWMRSSTSAARCATS